MGTLTHTNRRSLLTIKEAAATLGLHPQTVRTKIARGELPALQLGGPGSAVRIDERELDAWLYEDPAVQVVRPEDPVERRGPGASPEPPALARHEAQP